ncbi:helix-turn-helix domain-containing protein [Paenibacillus sp. GCM10023252]|uniref:AraC family transcriptional regulator n=1 Tax=Paenibacillus sp. GCM10023252 TaxID=3252649 RepID=UPI00360BAEC0
MVKKDGDTIQPETYTIASNPTIVLNEYMNVLFAGESQTRPGHRLGPKVFDLYLMHFVLSGRGIFECADEQYELREGHTFIIAPEQLVSYSSDREDPWRYRWIAFSGSLAASQLAAATGGTAVGGLGRGPGDEPGGGSGQAVLDTGQNRRVSALYHLIYRTFREGGASAHLRASGYLQLLFGEYAAAQGKGSTLDPSAGGRSNEQLVKQMVHYLSTQYAEPVSMERMADSLGYNRAYLSRVFKQRTELSPVTFLLRFRLDKARQLLRQRQELTIEQIAASVGLQDALYFSKQFRKLYGESPTAYRESVRKME